MPKQPTNTCESVTTSIKPPRGYNHAHADRLHKLQSEGSDEETCPLSEGCRCIGGCVGTDDKTVESEGRVNSLSSYARTNP